MHKFFFLEINKIKIGIKAFPPKSSHFEIEFFKGYFTILVTYSLIICTDLTTWRSLTQLTK